MKKWERGKKSIDECFINIITGLEFSGRFQVITCLIYNESSLPNFFFRERESKAASQRVEISAEGEVVPGLAPAVSPRAATLAAGVAVPVHAPATSIPGWHQPRGGPRPRRLPQAIFAA